MTPYWSRHFLNNFQFKWLLFEKWIKSKLSILKPIPTPSLWGRVNTKTPWLYFFSKPTVHHLQWEMGCQQSHKIVDLWPEIFKSQVTTEPGTCYIYMAQYESFCWINCQEIIEEPEEILKKILAWSLMCTPLGNPSWLETPTGWSSLPFKKALYIFDF